ncbi:MAG TPA: uroporphyrinogen decarboxylase family protein, partial [Candidatus Sulfotelmatobacter sp.]|nr:uroporphyrinogen decarboxylase family protein [Candidatus Sulfotelmatobacter sp.]
MNTRERFLAVMNFDANVTPPKWEFGYWASAVRRWYAEGLPRRVGLSDAIPDGEGVTGPGLAWRRDRPRDQDVLAACALDEGMERVPINILFCPVFRDEILEDHGDWVVRRDSEGVVRRERRDRNSLPRFVGWPVQSRDDWERLKAERLRPTLEGRFLCDWPKEKARLRSRTFPLAIGGSQGFYGTPRALLGEENHLMGFHDNPDLIKTLINDLCDFWIALFDRVLNEIDVDLALVWEDMSYKTGSLISPAMVREFMLPAYKKITAFYRDRGIKIILLDTDGQCSSLIPVFLDGGITGLYPFEVNAGMDVVEVRKAFPALQMLGGINKMAVAAGPADIDAELAARAPALQRGGYIPFIDHYVPPDVSWSHFTYYRRRLTGLIETSV